MNRHLRHNQSGASLMELIVYLGISTIVVLGMTSFVSALTRTRVRTADQQAVQSEARNLIERLTFAVRNSADLTTTGSRVDITDEAGQVTSFCACGGTVKTGQQAGSPAPEAALVPAIDSGIQVENLDFNRVSSSLRVTLTFKKNGQTASLTSTIAFRQSP